MASRLILTLVEKMYIINVYTIKSTILVGGEFFHCCSGGRDIRWQKLKWEKTNL